MLINIQVPIMQWIQGLFSWGQSFFEILFMIITFLGEELALYIIIPGIYWCYNKELGELIALTGFTSMVLNGAIKDVAKVDRPFVNYEGEINYVKIDNFFVNTVDLAEESYSFPSGHSQGVGTLLFSIASYFKNKNVWISATIITLLVMLSRLFFGVHWPLDVLVGALLGLGCAVLGCYLFTKFKNKRILIYFIAGFISLFALLVANKPDTYKAIGAIMGFAVGALVEHKYVNFEVSNVSKGKRVVRFIVGIILLLILKVGLKPLFALISTSVILDFLRYFILVFVAIAVYPMLFKKMKF